MDRKETFVSDELATMLMLQISHEQKNANLYAAISNYFDSIGLEGCHQWFKHQTEEETSHASMLIDYCTEAGVELDIQEVPKPELKKKEPNKLFDINGFDFPKETPNPLKYFHIWGSKRDREFLKIREKI